MNEEILEEEVNAYIDELVKTRWSPVHIIILTVNIISILINLSATWILYKQPTQKVFTR